MRFGVYLILQAPSFVIGVSLDKFFYNTEAEKLLIKFGKLILGVNRKSANFAVLSELGRYPFYLDIIKTVLKYWYHLENLDQCSLLHDALECSKNTEGCYNSWFNSLKKDYWILNVPLTSAAIMKGSTFTKQVAQRTTIRSPESQHVIKIFLASSQVSKKFLSEVQEQLTPQSMV